MKIWHKCSKAVFILVFCFMFLMVGKDVKASSLGTVSGLKQTSDTSNSARIEWGYVGGSSVRFEVHTSTQENGDFTKYDETYSSPLTIRNLGSASVYYVKVRPITKSGTTITEYGDFSNVIKIVTAPSVGVTNMKHTKSTTSSITVTWNAAAGANGYQVSYRDASTYSDSALKVMHVKTNSVTISGLSKDQKWNVYVKPYKEEDGYRAEYSSRDYLFNLPLIPTKVTGLEVENLWSNIGQMSAVCDKKACANGYQIELWEHNGKKKAKAATSTSNTYITLASSKLKQYKFLKIRTRAYVDINGSRKFGDWSSWAYLSRQPDVTKATRKANGSMKISWKKVNGASNYTVYVSNKSKSGYKKAITTKKTSYTITKCNKKKLQRKKRYYVYVVANKKVGKTTYKSPARYYWSK